MVTETCLSNGKKSVSFHSWYQEQSSKASVGHHFKLTQLDFTVKDSALNIDYVRITNRVNGMSG